MRIVTISTGGNLRNLKVVVLRLAKDAPKTDSVFWTCGKVPTLKSLKKEFETQTRFWLRFLRQRDFLETSAIVPETDFLPFQAFEALKLKEG